MVLGNYGYGRLINSNVLSLYGVSDNGLFLSLDVL